MPLKKGTHNSPKTEFKPGQKKTDEWKQMMSERRKGSKNPCWRGGSSSQEKIIRSSKEYSLWRNSVFEKDNYTCIWCGIKGNQTGGYLNADHIKPFAYFPELRFAIDNGRTLCVDCHKTTDSYKGRAVKNYKK